MIFVKSGHSTSFSCPVDVHSKRVPLYFPTLDGSKVEMALTVFGEDDLSEQSSFLSEGSAVAEVERELQAVVMTGHKGQEERGKTSRKLVPPSSSLLPSFTSPPLHLHPSHSSSSDSNEDSAAHSSPSSSSPSPTRRIPTALEERYVRGHTVLTVLDLIYVRHVVTAAGAPCCRLVPPTSPI